jgi:hypothetical protein
MEYHPELEWSVPEASATKKFLDMPKVKPTKDPKIEEDAILKIMQLALYGVGIDAQQKGCDVMQAQIDTMRLFKEVGFIK